MDNKGLPLEQLGIQLPYNIEAEQAVLGAAVLSAQTIPLLMEKLRAEHFYAQQNAAIFAEIMALFAAGGNIDFVTILNAVVSAGVFEDEQAAKVYLTTVAQTVPSISGAESYAEIVYEKYLVRQLAHAAEDILISTQEGEGAQVLLEAAEQRIYEIRNGRDTSTLTSLRSALFETLQRLQQITGPDKDKYMGIPTGFKYLDHMLTGLGRSDLIILAARPGMGKTSFALNIATNVAKNQKIPVAIFSLEMTKEQLASRMVAAEATIDSQSMRTGSLTGNEWNAIASTADELGDTPIYLDDTSGITIAQMKAKVRRVNQNPNREKIGLIVIDYLQLMQSGSRRNENRVQEVSEMTRSLKIMAKELDVPIVVLSQLSRGPEKNAGASGSRRPVLSDLRDSGSIEQDADVVLFLYREAYYDPEKVENANTAECIIAKNRHGEVGKVYLGWDGAHTRFYNVDIVHTDEY
ncbi:replicative DNA helicase [Ruminococcaceae bacterium OttesenSCG-928-N02]|nr:replicative DNA helicase [Ruminococcaceae bacterium OttesenSCG-928-N02]